MGAWVQIKRWEFRADRECVVCNRFRQWKLLHPSVRTALSIWPQIVPQYPYGNFWFAIHQRWEAVMEWRYVPSIRNNSFKKRLENPCPRLEIIFLGLLWCLDTWFMKSWAYFSNVVYFVHGANETSFRDDPWIWRQRFFHQTLANMSQDLSQFDAIFSGSGIGCNRPVSSYGPILSNITGWHSISSHIVLCNQIIWGSLTPCQTQ